MKTYRSLLVALLLSAQSMAQTNFNLDSLITANAMSFTGSSQFAGRGWEQLLENARRTNYVLIGEDHFISEVPLFTQALMQRIKFDNYVCEIDPWMLNVFKEKLTLPEAQQKHWITANSNGFSFFQKKNELELLRFLINNKVGLIGTEQVGLMSTTILLQQLAEIGSQKNRPLYKRMLDSSRVVNQGFFNDFSKPFFLVTPFFKEAIGKLDRSVMKSDEVAVIDDMIRSASIYETGSHRNRIKLMQRNLLSNYEQMKGKKNLFKFGANHTMKGESYLPVYDIGTTAHIWAQAENQDSYHILVLPKAGNQAGFLSGSNAIDLESEPFKSLKPFFDRSSNSEWTFIDLEKIRAEVRKKQFDFNNPYLEKSVNGYDALVVIPMATAAEAVK